MIFFILTGCSYSFHSTAYPNLKKILIQPFENKTAEYYLGDDLLVSLTNQFRDDGRLRPVTLTPDCQLEGTILDFSNLPFSYDQSNSIQEYQVKILFSVTLTDLQSNQVIYENKSLLISENYSVISNEGTSSFKTKLEAEKQIYVDLFQNILKNSLESW
ncbi:MAG TPA: LptE family protein [Candidatus Cloacimonadota bacterium]|nr:LptE family protein [Candidatus Cloacimonadota bacterium]HPT70949.1 LptE family protein [Candidatus Cloacimonadota bacterium]